MITVYQELIPLSNKMHDAVISENGTYTNPVIIPFVFNATGAENIMETVIYLKNDSQEKYYSGIVVSLMKEIGDTPQSSVGQLNFNNGNITFNLNGHPAIDVEPAYLFSQSVSGNISINNSYKSTYVPVEDDGIVNVKLSYGYEELSYSDWKNKKSVLAIPLIGTPGQADLSYIPIRMRMTWKQSPNVFTIRDYFVDVSYVSENSI